MLTFLIACNAKAPVTGKGEVAPPGDEDTAQVKPPALTYTSEVPLIGGRTVEGEANLVAVGGGSTVLLVDVSDVGAPVVLAEIPDLGEVSDVEIADGVLYTASDTMLTGDPVAVRVYDLTDPTSPALVATIGPPVDDAHTLSTGDGHLVLASTSNGWFAVYDVTDPASPTRVSVWSPHGGGVHDETWAGDRLWVAYTSGWACLDVSNPAAPFALFEAEADWDEPFVHNLSPTADGNVVAMSEEKIGGSMRVWDVSDLDDVSLASAYATDPTHSVHTVLVEGDTAFAAWFTDGLLVFNLADPASPELLAQHDTYTSGNQGPGEDGRNNINGATSVWTEGEVVAVADSMRGLVLFTWSIIE